MNATGAAAGMDDAELASSLAREAGELLLQVRQGSELSARELKDAGDRESQLLLASRLTELRPRDSVLSEEAVDDPSRLSAERVWIIDPLDGTREYSEQRHDWAVHIALWSQGRLSAGAVALPGHDQVLSTSDAAPGRTAHAGGPLRLAVSRTRPPAVLARLAEVLELELVPMGSAGYKAMAVVRGEVDAYVHAGGQYEWDSAAPVAVAAAAGLHTSRIDGSPLVYNRPDPLLPDLVIAAPDVAERLMAALASVLEASDVVAAGEVR